MLIEGLPEKLGKKTCVKYEQYPCELFQPEELPADMQCSRPAGGISEYSGGGAGNLGRSEIRQRSLEPGHCRTSQKMTRISDFILGSKGFQESCDIIWFIFLKAHVAVMGVTDSAERQELSTTYKKSPNCKQHQ